MLEIKLVIAIAFLAFVCGWGVGIFRGMKLSHKATMKTIDEAFNEDRNDA